MKKPVGPKARPSLKNCKPEPGPGPTVKVQARARPAREKKLKPEPGPSPRKLRPDTSLIYRIHPCFWQPHNAFLINKFYVASLYLFFKKINTCIQETLTYDLG